MLCEGKINTQVLLQGKVKNDLYVFDLDLNKKTQLDVGITLNYQINQDLLSNSPFVNIPTRKLDNTTINNDATLWHRRLVHPFIGIVRNIMSTCNKPCIFGVINNRNVVYILSIGKNTQIVFC